MRFCEQCGKPIDESGYCNYCRQYVPSPERIRQGRLERQKTWTPSEERRRRGASERDECVIQEWDIQQIERGGGLDQDSI